MQNILYFLINQLLKVTKKIMKCQFEEEIPRIELESFRMQESLSHWAVIVKIIPAFLNTTLSAWLSINWQYLFKSSEILWSVEYSIIITLRSSCIVPVRFPSMSRIGLFKIIPIR